MGFGVFSEIRGTLLDVPKLGYPILKGSGSRLRVPDFRKPPYEEAQGSRFMGFGHGSFVRAQGFGVMGLVRPQGLLLGCSPLHEQSFIGVITGGTTIPVQDC